MYKSYIKSTKSHLLQESTTLFVSVFLYLAKDSSQDHEFITALSSLGDETTNWLVLVKSPSKVSIFTVKIRKL